MKRNKHEGSQHVTNGWAFLASIRKCIGEEGFWMARPLRIQYPEAFYHVTSRGNERKPIFRTEKDYGRFMGYFESPTERYGAKVESIV